MKRYEIYSEHCERQIPDRWCLTSTDIIDFVDESTRYEWHLVASHEKLHNAYLDFVENYAPRATTGIYGKHRRYLVLCATVYRLVTVQYADDGSGDIEWSEVLTTAAEPREVYG